MKSASIFFFAVCFLFSATVQSQDRFFTVTSKDSINGIPRFQSSLGANMKLNGYFDVFGGLQDNETFNVGLISVFGDDDEKSFQMDLYQTQIKFDTYYALDDGQVIKAVVEFDFWGGDGRMRLRKAYIETKHWQIGQNWNNFGDEVLWPNIMEWEGPPSGVWIRSPHLKYMNSLSNQNWNYTLSLEAPITDYLNYDDLEPLVEDARQVTPDFTSSIQHKKGWGHIRLAGILRYIRYKLNDEIDGFVGYGFSLSGKYTKNKGIFQYQLVGGKGITAYMTSVAGLGYDGYPTTRGDFNATPAYGGWATYEYFITKKLHTNVVFGYTQFNLEDMERFILATDISPDLIHFDGNVRNYHYYGIVNLMYDPYKRMTFGLELDYGVKHFNYSGLINNINVSENRSRDAMRISFGFMFYF
ncbi:hypothetical protein [Mangrovimonas aestuarii]|uniref:hypothetical protein n=1 Tax=Mangrovimonas aestuarii TaxID=3018443 RepID=UPI002378DDA0|nr:hypothetical protein [Mangrovimonas aestuarii]